MTLHVFLKLKEVKRRTAKEKTQIYRDMKAGTFPKQVPNGDGGVAWLESEIIMWQQNMMNKRRRTWVETMAKQKSANDNQKLNGSFAAANDNQFEKQR